MATHIVQSPQWGEAKTKCGTPAVRVGTTQYTLHKMPYTGYFVANSPKVDPFEIDWPAIKKSAEEHSAVVVNFDIPNILTNANNARGAEELFKKYCVRAPRNTFAKSNVILDITKSEEELLANMHKKHRYNIGIAQRKGVSVKEGKNQEDFDLFFDLVKKTAERQKYFVRPKRYYQTIWNTLAPIGMTHLLIAQRQKMPLAAWMLFTYANVLYYPYGGSAEEHKTLQASTLIGWEAIKLGKRLGCQSFDMWGAADNPNDEHDPYHGFTTLKIRYGGKHVTYIDSYDLVINKPAYDLYNVAQNIRWKLLKALK